MINSIKNNTISETDTKKKINELNEIKKAEIKDKRLINGQKMLLNLFDDLVEAILINSNDSNNNNNNNSNNINSNNKSNNNSNNNESNSKNANENESKNKSKNESESENENKNENQNENKNKNENESNDEYYYEIRQLNNWFKTIDQTKSLEEQLKLLKERGEFLDEYWYVEYYHGNKELN